MYISGVQAGNDAGAGLRLVPARLVQGELVRYRPAQVSISLSHKDISDLTNEDDFYATVRETFQGELV